MVSPKPGVFSRLGGMKDEESSTNKTALSSSKNVFSRLGDMDEWLNDVRWRDDDDVDISVLFDVEAWRQGSQFMHIEAGEKRSDWERCFEDVHVVWKLSLLCSNRILWVWKLSLLCSNRILCNCLFLWCGELNSVN